MAASSDYPAYEAAAAVAEAAWSAVAQDDAEAAAWQQTWPETTVPSKLQDLLVQAGQPRTLLRLRQASACGDVALLRQVSVAARKTLPWSGIQQLELVTSAHIGSVADRLGFLFNATACCWQLRRLHWHLYGAMDPVCLAEAVVQARLLRSVSIQLDNAVPVAKVAALLQLLTQRGARLNKLELSSMYPLDLGPVMAAMPPGIVDLSVCLGAGHKGVRARQATTHTLLMGALHHVQAGTFVSLVADSCLLRRGQEAVLTRGLSRVAWLRRLHLRRSVCTQSAGAALARAVRHLACLEDLDLTGSVIDDRESCSLDLTMLRGMPRLRVLTLSACSLTQADPCVLALAEALPLLSALCTLDLLDNLLRNEAMLALAPGLAHCSQLVRFHASLVRLTDPGELALVAVLTTLAGRLVDAPCPRYQAGTIAFLRDVFRGPHALALCDLTLPCAVPQSDVPELLLPALALLPSLAQCRLAVWLDDPSTCASILTDLAEAMLCGKPELRALHLRLSGVANGPGAGDALAGSVAKTLRASHAPRLQSISLEGFAAQPESLADLVAALQQPQRFKTLQQVTLRGDATHVLPMSVADRRYRLAVSQHLPARLVGQYDVLTRDADAPAWRVPRLIELALTRVLCEPAAAAALAKPSNVPRQLQATQLRPRFLPCVSCGVETMAPRVECVQAMQLDSLQCCVVRAAMCPYCFHGPWKRKRRARRAWHQSLLVDS